MLHNAMIFIIKLLLILSSISLAEPSIVTDTEIGVALAVLQGRDFSIPKESMHEALEAASKARQFAMMRLRLTMRRQPTIRISTDDLVSCRGFLHTTDPIDIEEVCARIDDHE